MQGMNGLLLVLTGVLLSIGMLLPPGDQSTTSSSGVTQISAAPDLGGRPALAERFATAQARSDAASLRQPADATGALGSAPGSTPHRETRAALDLKPAPWTTVVKADPSAPANGKIASSKPGDWEARSELARDLQQELTRTGCYGGEINGAWTQSTRRAMARFITAVNASLPFKDPDYILLTLVRSHPSTVCGGGCGRDEVAADDGRCLPRAIVAQTERARDRAHRAATVTASQPERVATLTPPGEHWRIASPARDAATDSDAASAMPSQPEQRQQPARYVTIEKLPWLAESTRAASQPLPATKRPDGMMSVGAPLPLPSDVEADRQRTVAFKPMTDDAGQTGAVPPPPALDVTLGIEPETAPDIVPAAIAPDKIIKDRPRRSARNGSKKYAAKRSSRRSYYGYAWAGQNYPPRRYFKRRFIAPFNMMQRLDGIY